MTCYRRLDPQEAHAAAVDGAVLVDIRPVADRVAEGAVPDAWVIDHAALLARFDPVDAACLDLADRYDVQLIVLCSDGAASEPVVAALLALGNYRVTDVDGGFRAWKRSGLPTRPA